MIYYYGAKPSGRPFISSSLIAAHAGTYFAWNDDTRIGCWVHAITGQFVSKSRITPDMSVMEWWVRIDPPGENYIDEGL